MEPPSQMIIDEDPIVVCEDQSNHRDEMESPEIEAVAEIKPVREMAPVFVKELGTIPSNWDFKQKKFVVTGVFRLLTRFEMEDFI